MTKHGFTVTGDKTWVYSIEPVRKFEINKIKHTKHNRRPACTIYASNAFPFDLYQNQLAIN